MVMPSISGAPLFALTLLYALLKLSLYSIASKSLGCALSLSFHIRLNDLDAFTSLREQVKKLEYDKKKLIVQLVDYEELKSENERLKKQLAKK